MERLPPASLADDPTGWLIVGIGTVVTIWTIVFALRATIAPGETDPNHPKMLILKDNR